MFRLRVWGPLFRTIRLIAVITPMLCVCLLLSRMVSAVLPSVLIFLTKELTDAAALTISGETDFALCIRILLFFLFFSLANILLQQANQYLTLVMQQRIRFKMETMLIDKSISIPLIRFEQPQYYDQLQRARSTVALNGYRVTDQLFTSGQLLLTLGSFVVLLWQFNRWLPLALLVYIVPSLLVNMKVGDWKYWLMKFQTPFTRRMQYLLELLIGRASSKEVRIYNLTMKLTEEWSNIFWKNAGEQRKVEVKTVKARTSVESIQGLLGMSFILYAIWICYANRLTIGYFVAVFQVLNSTQDYLKNLTFQLASLYENTLELNDFYRFIDSVDDSVDDSVNRGSRTLDHPINGISVRNLCFSYPSSPVPILKGISFEIKPNQTVAIVGENGAGKSTLVNCLIGLYRHYSGSIAYNGIELNAIDERAFNKSVAVIFQDFLRFQFTPRDNIGFGDIQRSNHQAAIETAASSSGAADTIGMLPDGYDTLLGPAFEGGTELSVGQWQRLALARAIFKDSPIVVLDEPTASMDPIAEVSFYKRIKELTDGRITLFISHRLGSCKLADNILVLRNGELVEQGSHEELMSIDGVYRRMYQEQASWYS